MSNNHAIARPYAEAAFDYAREKNLFDQWSTQLQSVGAVINDPRIANLLTDPRVGEKTVAQALMDVTHHALDEHIKNFILFLAENRRLHVLPGIAELYEEYRAAYEKKVHVTVTSAFPLPKNEQESLQRALEIRLQREVVMHTKEDKTLLGGAIVKAGDLVIDGSIRGKLSRMSQELMA